MYVSTLSVLLLPALATAGVLPRVPAAAQGGNLQSFSGALGGVQAAPVTNSGDAKRPFAVDGTTDVNLGAALQRSCAVQHNGCAQKANANKNAGFKVSDCDAQQQQCNAAGKGQAGGAQGGGAQGGGAQSSGSGGATPASATPTPSASAAASPAAGANQNAVADSANSASPSASASPAPAAAGGKKDNNGIQAQKKAQEAAKKAQEKAKQAAKKAQQKAKQDQQKAQQKAKQAQKQAQQKAKQAQQKAEQQAKKDQQQSAQRFVRRVL